MTDLKVDLTGYSVNELSSLVFNDISLYMDRHETGFLKLIGTIYKYTEDQLEVLVWDLHQDLLEMNEAV